MSGPKEKQAMTKSAFIKEVHDAEAMLYHVAKSILKMMQIVVMLFRKRFSKHMKSWIH